jgi:hypothetical protein
VGSQKVTLAAIDDDPDLLTLVKAALAGAPIS